MSEGRKATAAVVSAEAAQELQALAVRAGRTPFYVYDTAVVDSQLAALRAVLPTEVRLHYAVKANPFPPLVDHLAQHVDGFDVASGGELALALEAPLPRGFDIGFAGPGKSLEEIRAGVAADVLFQCESVRELRAIAAAGQAAAVRPRVALRINPDIQLRGAGQRMGGGPRPFGIDAEAAPEVLALLATLPVDFAGFHFYAGSQMLDAATVVALLEHCYACAVALAAHAPAPVRVLNLGGGFGVPYYAGEQPLDLAPIGAVVHRLVERAAVDFPEAQLVLELGRYLVAPAGRYVTRVVDRKVSRGEVFLVCDGGMNHHLAASGNLGQVLRRNFPVQVVKAPVEASLLATGQSTASCLPQKSREQAPSYEREDSPVGASLLATETVTICGPLCTPLDVLAQRVELPVAAEGDFVVIGMSGAYGATASPRGFLSHRGPVELLVAGTALVDSAQPV
jgi:diaminopimelate decarboxylase